MPGMHDAAMAAVECACEPYVSLIGEEPGTHRGSARRQAADAASVRCCS